MDYYVNSIILLWNELLYDLMIYVFYSMVNFILHYKQNYYYHY